MKLFQIIFVSISLPALTVLAVLLRNKSDKIKQNILYYTSIAALLIHLSVLFTTFFSTSFTSNFMALSATIWPVFPCNLTTWLMPFVFFKYKPKEKLYAFIATVGIVGGLVTMLTPTSIYGSVLSWEIVRTLISHSLAVFVGLYAFVSGKCKPKLKDTISVALGTLGYALFGYVTIFLFDYFKHVSINAMYILQPAIPNTILNGYFIAAVYIALCATFFFIWEKLSNKKTHSK